VADGGTLALTQQLTHLTDLGAPMESRTWQQPEPNPFASQPQNSPSQPLFQVSIVLESLHVRELIFIVLFRTRSLLKIRETTPTGCASLRRASA